MALASALLQVMMDAVRKTARPMLRDFGEVSQLQVSRKGPGDFVTAADVKAEQTLFELLLKAQGRWQEVLDHYEIGRGRRP